MVIVFAVYFGDPAEGERLVQPLRELGEPLIDHSRALPWTYLQSLFDSVLPNGKRYYWKIAVFGPARR